VQEDTQKHWLLGYHAAIQNAANAEAMEMLCSLSWEEAVERANELVLLLQLDSDLAAGMEWGDAGTLYFWIHQDDLAAWRFDKVWMILQCY
jgi:uncharacterized protein YwqG